MLRQKDEIVVSPNSPDEIISTTPVSKKDKKKKRFSFGDKTEKSEKDKAKKEKKSEKKSKKHKSDKTDKGIVNVEINHNIQEETEEQVIATVTSDDEVVAENVAVSLLSQAQLDSPEISVRESVEVENSTVESSATDSVDTGQLGVGLSVSGSVEGERELPAIPDSIETENSVEELSVSQSVSADTVIIESAITESFNTDSSINIDATDLVTETPVRFESNIPEESLPEVLPSEIIPQEFEEVVAPTVETTVEASIPEFFEDSEVTVEVSDPAIEVSDPNIEASSPEIESATVEISEISENVDEAKALNRSLSFSNSSIFYEQDNNNQPLNENAAGSSFANKKLRNKKKRKIKKSEKSDKANQDKQEKRSKSFSMMLKSNRKKDNKSGTISSMELSTNKLTPGILKVFGDLVSKGSNYKAVRVSTISTAQEVVRMALERYGFENSNTKEYVLCDVVGTIHDPESTRGSKKHNKHKKTEKSETDDEEKPKWTTEYIRAVNDNEKPLVLQSLWKPTNGRARRFELRRRVDVESSCFFINTAEGMGRRGSETSLFDDSEHSSIISGNESVGRSTSPIDKTDFRHVHSKSKKSSGRNVDSDSNQAPLYVPYLLLLQGCKNISDKLIHKLDDPTNIVGPYLDEDQKQCNIMLHSSDILLPHCWIYKKIKLEEDSSETNLDEINFLVFIEPANGAEITVNGDSISTTTLLRPGQFVGFGKHYLFIFKDPTQSLDAAILPQIESVMKQNGEGLIVSAPIEDKYAVPIKLKKTEDKSVQVELLQSILSDQTEDSDEESDVSSDENMENYLKTHTNMAPRKHVEKSQLQFSYDIKEEDELLHTIIDIADGELGGKQQCLYAIIGRFLKVFTSTINPLLSACSLLNDKPLFPLFFPPLYNLRL